MPEATDKPQVVLTIAGFDPSSGAGVTADLQVFAAYGLYGTAAITALTVQSTLGVAAVEPVSGAFLRHTLEHLVADLLPAGIKIGMLGSADVVREVACFLHSLSDVGRLAGVPVVLDPVLRSSSGTILLVEDGLTALREELLPLVSWVTPNSKELEILVSDEDCGPMEALARLGAEHPALQAVVTGGDDAGAPTDIWRAPGGVIREFVGTRVDTTSTHGTGCAFSSALMSRLVLGDTPAEAIAGAKKFVEGALWRAPGVGNGRGPMNLLWPLRDC